MTRLSLPAAATLALLLASASPVPAEAKVPLREEPHINAQLLAAQIGDILRKTCPSASARMFVVFGKLQALKSYAEDKGYSEDEVRAFLKDRDEKARIRGAAEAWLDEAGAVKGDADSYCRVARAEVDKGSLVGQIIRVSD